MAVKWNLGAVFPAWRRAIVTFDSIYTRSILYTTVLFLLIIDQRALVHRTTPSLQRSTMSLHAIGAALSHRDNAFFLGEKGRIKHKPKAYPDERDST